MRVFVCSFPRRKGLVALCNVRRRVVSSRGCAVEEEESIMLFLVSKQFWRETLQEKEELDRVNNLFGFGTSKDFARSL